MKQDIKLIIQVSKGLVKRVDDYRFKNRVPSRAEAVRQLIEKSLPRTKKATSRK